MDQNQAIVINFLKSLFPATVWNWDYFTSLWKKYANVGGFFVGAIVIAMVYFASDIEEGKKRRIIRVFSIVVLINAVDGIYILMMNVVNSLLFHSITSQYEAGIHGAFNPLSLLIVVLVISECYRNKPRHVFFFGLSTFSVSILMFGSGYSDDIILIYLFVRVIFIAIVCTICSKITYTFVTYIVTGVYFIFTETIQSYILYLNTFSGVAEVKKDILSIICSFRAEYIIMCFIVIVFALFELFVLTNGKINIKNFAFGRAATVIVLSVLIMIVTLYVIMLKNDLTEQIRSASAKVEKSYSTQEINASYAEASSSLTTNSGNTYGPEYTIDGLGDTCWQDGQEGDGIGETLTYYFDLPVLLNKIMIVNGRTKSENKYYENNRLSEAVLYYYMDDNMVSEQTILFEDSYNTEASVFNTNGKIECNKVILEVKGVFKGTIYHDLCITDISFEELVEE